ncbi:Histone-lysine N-methyltransferase 2B [Chionoecetes opilio]|uniref:Histone-lysine N-methyltransferase 2B n=1 Tax=Chionoecetes opilio TaxID=41210 RepID=A0A8J4YSP9_CHIOP|nr:Histone-lysine N-methyltransferase 2B [Chionoecetes opilio]
MHVGSNHTGTPVTHCPCSLPQVLRKTQWCGKCRGCTTPNCLKCSNCQDMKKYGGRGTKKKPCIKRKCQNPRLSIRSGNTQDVVGKGSPPLTTTAIAATTTVTTTVSTPVTSNSQKESRKVSVVNLKVEKKVQEKVEELDPESDSTAKSLEAEKGGVFVPRQMPRTQPDQKDRGDIAAGKKFVPSALVNIDYWQGYDADEMMLTGYPVTTASPLHPQRLCFRCGSLGKEQLLYCAWCSEGIHPYCLEDGEGPESEAEEVFWICRRCAVCHVCGAPGADSLLRCSDCRNYYHLECLGPTAHSTCQPTPDRPWEADLKLLLGGSWPRQSAIYDVSGGSVEGDGGGGGGEDIVVHTELDVLKEAGDNGEEMPDIFFLPVIHKANAPNLSDWENAEDSDHEVDIEELEDSVCLEESLVEVFRDADLYPPVPSPTANPGGGQVVSMKEDEYLYLGYKKLCEYPSRKLELSYFRLLQSSTTNILPPWVTPRGRRCWSGNRWWSAPRAAAKSRARTRTPPRRAGPRPRRATWIGRKCLRSGATRPWRR